MRRKGVDVLWKKQKHYTTIRVSKATYTQPYAKEVYKYQVSVFRKKEATPGLWIESRKMVWSSSWVREDAFNECLHKGIMLANEYDAKRIDKRKK